MKFIVKYRGDPLAEVPSLVAGYIRIREEFQKRWPRAIYGPSEAAAHGFTLCGVPELTPEEARQLRRELQERPEPIDLRAQLRQERIDAANLGAALRPGVIQ